MISNNVRACQCLVLGQVSVNRAVWAMNEQGDHESDATQHGADISDEYIMREIKAAIKDLSEALNQMEVKK